LKKFYSGKGDDGLTGMLGDQRIPKHSLRMEVIGCLDEANAVIGIVRSQTRSGEVREIILTVQKQLYMIMGEIAASKENAEKFRKIDSTSISWLEGEIDRISEKVNLPGEFIVPGDTKGGAFIALARTVVRRAERRVTELFSLNEIENEFILAYLNRLSSLCFVLELYENNLIGKGNQTLVK
jgi:cob(I)alamin adenosyltransferase